MPRPILAKRLHDKNPRLVAAIEKRIFASRRLGKLEEQVALAQSVFEKKRGDLVKRMPSRERAAWEKLWPLLGFDAKLDLFHALRETPVEPMRVDWRVSDDVKRLQRGFRQSDLWYNVRAVQYRKNVVNEVERILKFNPLIATRNRLVASRKSAEHLVDAYLATARNRRDAFKVLQPLTRQARSAIQNRNVAFNQIREDPKLEKMFEALHVRQNNEKRKRLGRLIGLIMKYPFRTPIDRTRREWYSVLNDYISVFTSKEQETMSNVLHAPPGGLPEKIFSRVAETRYYMGEFAISPLKLRDFFVGLVMRFPEFRFSNAEARKALEEFRKAYPNPKRK